MTHRCAHTRVTAYRVNRCNMSPAPIIMDHHHQTCCLCRWIRHSLVHYWSCGDRTNRRRNICEGTVISVQINRQGEPSCVSMYENDENCRWKISPCIQGSHSDPPPSSSQLNLDGWYIYGIYKFLWKTLTQTRIWNPKSGISLRGQIPTNDTHERKISDSEFRILGLELACRNP